MKKTLKRRLLLLLSMALTATFVCCAGNAGNGSSATDGSQDTSQESTDNSNDTDTDTDNSNDTDTDTDTPDKQTKAKVIVLAGQSNAVGHSYSKYLNKTAQTKFANGFDNVQIYYSNNPYSTSISKNESTDGFTKVMLGQGRGVDTTEHIYGNFGPEVGLAEYLSETYPDETFYIIKDATGGTRLWDRWYSTSSYGYRGGEVENSLYTHMMNWVDDGMELLEAQGLDAEIVSFAWMQGENDSLTYVSEYGYLWANLVTDIKTEWSAKGYLPENGLSVVSAGITDYWTNYQTMNAVKKAYADMSSKHYFIDVANSNWVSYSQDNTDYAHLDAAAMIALGRAFGENVKNAINDLGNAETYTFTGTGWDGFTKTALTGAGTQEDPYVISTEAEFATFAINVKDGNTYEGKFIQLANDITMSNPCFTGVGGVSGAYNAYDSVIKRAFAGTFDGNNKTVTVNLYGPSFMGLFRGNTGTVKNLTVAGNVTGGNYDTGAVVAYNYFGTVYNCVNTAKIASNYDGVPFHYGGVVGYSYGGTIENCTNLADIKMVGHTIGGIAGYAGYAAHIKGCVNGNATDLEKGSIEANYELGGIAGLAGSSTVENCINYMKVVSTSTATGKTGGIVGGLTSTTTIDGCKNYGDIECGKSYAGGILGYSNHKSPQIKNCENYGAITVSDKGAGGIVGLFNVAGTYTIENCHNYSNSITATSQAGGVVGRVADALVNLTVKNCSSNGSFAQADVVGSAGAKATITMENTNTETQE